MEKKRPNILFILNDHQAYYGHGQVKRPVFDSLAMEGIHFTNAHTVCPLCGPARRSMLTGLYPHNHRELQNDTDHPYHREVYLDLMARGGYRQFYYGKWHAGAGTALDHGCEGFNYASYNNPYTKAEYKQYLLDKGLPEPEIFIEYDFIPDSERLGRVVKQDGEWCNEHCAGMMTTSKETHEAFFLAYLAKEKLKELAGQSSGAPFSMRVDFWGPHQPYFPTEEFAAMYPPSEIALPLSLKENVYLNGKPALYAMENNKGLNENGRLLFPSPLSNGDWQHILSRCYGQISLVDAAAGMILEGLKEYGLEENTMVIMTTDHGDAVACHGGHFDKAAYMPQEMLRIPMAIRFPGVIPPKQVSALPVSNLDMAPTVLDAAGLAFSSPVDGMSLLPVSRDSQTAFRDYTVCETHGHFCSHIGRALITDRYKYTYNQGDLDELYDLANDPFELKNLAVSDAAPQVLQAMRARLRAWAGETGDTAVVNNL